MCEGTDGVTGLIEWRIVDPPVGGTRPVLLMRGVGRLQHALASIHDEETRSGWVLQKLMSPEPIEAQIEWHCLRFTRILLWAQSVPMLTVEELAPILESDDPSLRETAFRLLGTAPPGHNPPPSASTEEPSDPLSDG
jgi:hypothetical protein